MTDLKDAIQNAPKNVEVEHQILDLETNKILIHVKITENCDEPPVSVMPWASQLKEMMPSNALVIFTKDNVSIDIKRPKHCEVSFKGCEFSSASFISAMKTLFDERKEFDTVNITFSDCIGFRLEETENIEKVEINGASKIIC